MLSKFLGSAKQFKKSLEEYGIKIARPDSLASFLRLFNANGNDTIQWYKDSIDKLKNHEALFTKFLLNSGLRTSEAIHSFNLIIKLGRQGNLSEYYDAELKVLMH